MTHSSYRPSHEETTQELRPAGRYVEGDPRTQYWASQGVVYFRDQVVPQSDSASFRFFISGFAADAHRCYLNGRIKKSLNPTALNALSFAYHRDDVRVRTHTAEAAGADVSTFVALDSGIRTIPGGVFPYILVASGYAKDKKRAYFCDGGNAMPLAKADPTSFVAIADSFAADEQSVFWGRASLPKVKRNNWRRLGGAFSTDGVRVYSRNHIIEGADPESFVVYPDNLDMFSYARDRHSYYGGSNKISRTEFERRVGDA